MATEVSYTGDGSDTTFDITFPFLKESHIGVSVAGVTKNVTTDYTISGTVVTFTSAPANAAAIKIYRNTNIDTPEHDYSAGSSITAASLNNNQKQVLYAIEEAKLVTTTSGGITTGNKNDITVNSDTDWVIRANAIEKSMMADNSVGTNEIETNAVGANEIAPNAVGSSELADDAVDTAAIKDDAVTMAKLNAGALPTNITVDYPNILGDAIRHDVIKNGEITLAKLASAVANSLTPVGTVIWYSGSTAPTGYLKCNGDAIANGSGTTQSITADFSELYAIVGANLPDLRGEFIRGFDDGKGTDSGRTIRSSQTDELKAHTHTYVDQIAAQQGYRPWKGGDNDCGSDDKQTESTGGTETRPRNIALLACIKY